MIAFWDRHSNDTNRIEYTKTFAIDAYANRNKFWSYILSTFLLSFSIAIRFASGKLKRRTSIGTRKNWK